MEEKSFMQGIVDEFVRLFPQRFSGMQNALAYGSFKDLGAIAHQLRGTAGALGFPQIGSLAEKIEQEAEGSARVAVIEKLLAELERLGPSA